MHEVMRVRYLIVVICLGMGLSSCSSFLEEYSQDTDYVRTWKDLDELLIGDCYWPVAATYNFNMQSNQGMFIHLLADELEEQNSASSGRSNGMFDDHQRLFGYLTWQQRVGQNETYSGYFAENEFWTQAYKKINIANNVLYSLDAVPRVTVAEREGAAKVEGEARFLRAYYYWILVNLYGQPYVPATASTQPGVPLKTRPEVEDQKFSRATVEQVYALIENDLKAADAAFEQLTSTTRHNLYRASHAAVHLLQSRVYLYMQQWEEAARYAQKVIQEHGQLQDLRMQSTPMMQKTCVENIFSMGGDDLPAMMDYTWQSLRVSHDLYAAYAANDLRRMQWLWRNGSFRGLMLRENGAQYLTAPLPATSSDTYYYYAYTFSLETRTSPVSSIFWLRSSEAYLNLAEAEAYLGHEEEARAAVNTLRRARFSDSGSWQINSAGAQLITDVRAERRRELLLQGQRWFDLRRYRVCAVQPERIALVHNYTYYADRGTTIPLETHRFVLTEDDPSWTLPIPQEVLNFNTGMEGNGNLWREFTVVPTEE